MKDLLIYGASSLARLAHYYATSQMGLNVLGFVVDGQYKASDSFLSLPVYEWSEVEQLGRDNINMHVSIGYRSMRSRSNAYAQAKRKGFELVNIVSSASFVADDVKMGDNNLIMPGVVIEPGAKLGSNNVVWSNATICHGATIKDDNFIAANVTIGGEASIGSKNFFGFSSVLLQKRAVGNEVLVGAASLMLDDSEDLSYYHGSPAIRIRGVDPDLGVCVE